MTIEKIEYAKALELADSWIEKENPENKILGLIFSREDCGACTHMIDVVLPDVKITEEFELYEVVTDDGSGVHFPPLRTPISYFYVPGSPKMPIIREGVGPSDAVEFDMQNMVKVLNGADYRKTFFGDAPDEAIPEHEKT